MYTFGTRNYALEILKILDPEEKWLKVSRLITRNESFKEIKELDKIIPIQYKDSLVIIDDTVSVWKHHLDILIKIIPYYAMKDSRYN